MAVLCITVRKYTLKKTVNKGPPGSQRVLKGREPIPRADSELKTQRKRGI